MQAKRAQELRRRWGDKPCTHPDADREYDLGGHTGDYACTTCGDTWWGYEGWQAARDRALAEYGGERPAPASDDGGGTDDDGAGDA